MHQTSLQTPARSSVDRFKSHGQSPHRRHIFQFITLLLPILIPCTTLMTLTQSPPPAIQTHNTQRNQPQPPIRILKPNTQANHHIPPRPQQTNSIPNDTLAHIAEILFNPPNIYRVAVTSRDNTTVVVTSRDNTTVVAQCDNTPRRSG